MIARLAAGVAGVTGEPIPPDDGQRRAAVAIVLHDAPEGVRVLLMKRATRESDPWSAHISLPGGGFHAEDRDLRTTAIRETREELGIALELTRPLGRLGALHPLTSGPKGIEVSPYIFVTTETLVPELGPEAESAFWLPLELVESGALDGMFEFESTLHARPVAFPCWNFEGHCIWGLTWRILVELLALTRAPEADHAQESAR